MKKFGLIGFPLTHSFSKKYFTEKFQKLKLENHSYELFEMEVLEKFPSLWGDSHLIGTNVTVPHKQNVIPLLSHLDESAKKVGAVNVIKRQNEQLIGFNTDYPAFKQSLANWLGNTKPNALILGTGGASKAIKTALEDLSIPYQFVSRTAEKGNLTYEQLSDEIILSHQLIINTTPLGTFPKVETAPDIPYHVITPHHYLYDLVYNPAETTFLRKGKEQGANIKNGLEMLELQAEFSWEIWGK